MPFISQLFIPGRSIAIDSSSISSGYASIKSLYAFTASLKGLSVEITGVEAAGVVGVEYLKESSFTKLKETLRSGLRPFFIAQNSVISSGLVIEVGGLVIEVTRSILPFTIVTFLVTFIVVSLLS